MATSTPDRFTLYEMMKEAWGEPLASGLIGRIPPMDITDIATKQDVENTGVLLRGEMAELRGEMGELRGEMGELRGEMGELRAELRGEMSELRGELRGEMSELRGELRSGMTELRAEFRASSRHTIVTIIAAAVSIWLTFYLPHVI